MKISNEVSKRTVNILAISVHLYVYRYTDVCMHVYSLYVRAYYSCYFTLDYLQENIINSS